VDCFFTYVSIEVKFRSRKPVDVTKLSRLIDTAVYVDMAP
jgi:hypothetical protein